MKCLNEPQSLTDLIDAVGDADGVTYHCHADEAVNIGSAYEAGHRACFEKLAPALKEAIEYLDLNYRTMPYRGHGADPTECDCVAHMAEEAFEQIRAILEGGGK